MLQVGPKGKPRFEVTVGIWPESEDKYEIWPEWGDRYENFRMIAKRAGFSGTGDGEMTIRKFGNNLQTLTAETEALTADLRAAKIKVTRIKIVETILDVEAE